MNFEFLKKVTGHTHADIWVQNGFIYLQPNGDYHRFVNKVASIGSASYHDEERQWAFPPSASIAKMILGTIGSDGRYHESFQSLVDQYHLIESAACYKTMEDAPEIPNLLRPAWNHQKQGYHFIRSIFGLNDQNPVSAGAGLFADMGTGKTAIALGLIVNHPSQIRRTLVVGPKSVIDNDVWVKEFRKNIPANLIPRIYNLTGSMLERAEILEMTKDRSGVWITNYDAMVYPVFSNALLQYEWDLIVLDEAHKIKAPGGKTSKFLAQLGRKAKFRLAQTGTPNADKPTDVYALYRFIDPGIFGTRFTRFAQQYAVYGGYMGRQIIGYQNLDDLHKKMFKIAFRATKDVLDLPSTVENSIYIKLGEKARKIYDEMENEMVTEVTESDRVSVNNSLTKIVRLQQITSGFLPVDVWEEGKPEPVGERYEIFDNPKQEALEDLLEGIDSNEPVVVFCKFIYDLKSIKEVCEKLGRPYYELSGRRKDLQAWQDATDGGVIACQITAGNAGVDFTRSCYCIYYSMSHSLTTYDQSLSRIHRPGQTRTVNYYYLTASRTVDVAIRAALRDKVSVSKYVLDAIHSDNLHRLLLDYEKGN